MSRIQDKGFTFFQEEQNAKAPNGILAFNQEMNYISSSQPAISKNVINYNGKQVWTIGNQQYCEIKKDEFGYRFVDISDCSTAKDIICNPALPYCSDDGTEIINIDSSGGSNNGKTCNELYGSFTNQFVPNPENPNQVCKVSCDGNKLIRSSCKAIPSCDKGILNTDYVCVSAIVPQGTSEDEDSYLFLGMIVAGLVLAGLSRKNALGGEE